MIAARLFDLDEFMDGAFLFFVLLLLVDILKTCYAKRDAIGITVSVAG